MSNTTNCAVCVKQSQALIRYGNLYRGLGASPLKEHYAHKRVETRKAQIAHARVCTD